MMWVEIPEREYFDEHNEEFITYKGCKFKIEHSLVSLAKWEAKFKLPFLHTKLNRKQWIDYIKCMTITQNVDPDAYKMITNPILSEIQDYVNNPQTATVITDNTPNRPHKKETITAELIYFWMTCYNIPFDCEKWHLSRLMTLIQVCSIKNNSNTKGTKMSRSEILRQNNRINAARRAHFNSKG